MQQKLVVGVRSFQNALHYDIGFREERKPVKTFSLTKPAKLKRKQSEPQAPPDLKEPEHKPPKAIAASKASEEEPEEDAEEGDSKDNETRQHVELACNDYRVLVASNVATLQECSNTALFFVEHYEAKVAQRFKNSVHDSVR